jgi:integrase
VGANERRDEQGRRLSWEGGYIRYDRAGTPTFYVYKKIGGRVFERSTRRHRESLALRELNRFWDDPAAYDPRGANPRDPLVLTKELVDEYLAFSARPPNQGGAGNTPEWVRKQTHLLADWMEALGAVDLRRLELATIKKHLQGVTSLHHRISVIKGLYTWLRKEARLKAAEDPVFGSLGVPQARAEQIDRSKLVELEDVKATVDACVGTYRDALVLQVATGWHTTEIVRFSKTGSVEEFDPPRGEVAGIVNLPLHKSGEPHRTRVSAVVLACAKRLLAHGAISREWYDRAVRAACRVAKRPDEKPVKQWSPGRLRHSVASWAIGTDEAAIQRVAEFLGHKSPRTTKKFYATWAAPKKIDTVY